jgi:hypothetical protein
VGVSEMTPEERDQEWKDLIEKELLKMQDERYTTFKEFNDDTFNGFQAGVLNAYLRLRESLEELRFRDELKKL